MPKKSRQLIVHNQESELPLGMCYCRKCRKIKLSQYFHSATDSNLDSNKFMSLCKSCIDILYTDILVSEKGSIDRTILRLCRMLNVMFDPSAIDSAMKDIESRGSDKNKLFGLYKQKLLVIHRSSVNDTEVDLTYQFENTNTPTIYINEDTEKEYKGIDNLKRFWGTRFSTEELDVLEFKFDEFASTHDIDTKTEKSLLKFICLKELDIEKAINEGMSTSALVKEYRELLKDMGISPNSANSASGGKQKDAFGVWLKEISTKRPEEWVEDKSIYKDVDNIEEYGEKYITSPLRSFVTGSREFSLDDNEIVESDNDDIMAESE